MGGMDISKQIKQIHLLKQMRQLEKMQFRNTLYLLKSYAKLHAEELAKLPYDFNLLALLPSNGINENTHSRIFAHLCAYKYDGEYTFLNHFISFLRTTIELKLPTSLSLIDITAEKQRIDVLIRAKECAIIIENKVKNAIDQIADKSATNAGQLYRYIGEVKSKFRYTDEQIFVVYLVRDRYHEPDERSWEKIINEKKRISIKSKYENRFCVISYKDAIYPWICNLLDSNCSNLNEPLLYSALVQYEDYLGNELECNKKYEAMNNRLTELLMEELELNGNVVENYLKVQDALNNIDNLYNSLEDLENRCIDSIWKYWADELSEMIKANRWSFFTYEEYLPEINNHTIEINASILGCPIVLYLVKEDDLMVGMENVDAKARLQKEIVAIREDIKRAIPDIDISECSRTYAYKIVDYTNGLGQFCQLLDVLEKILNVKSVSNTQINSSL